MIPPFAMSDSVSMKEKSQLVGRATPSVAVSVPEMVARTPPVMVSEAKFTIVLDGSRTMT